jgi:hypothetical protein
VARPAANLAEIRRDGTPVDLFVFRAGALYPFFRVSALLKHLDGRTRNLPVVL